jgi:hypothetical protein
MKVNISNEQYQYQGSKRVGGLILLQQQIRFSTEKGYCASSPVSTIKLREKNLQVLISVPDP